MIVPPRETDVFVGADQETVAPRMKLSRTSPITILSQMASQLCLMAIHQKTKTMRRVGESPEPTPAEHSTTSMRMLRIAPATIPWQEAGQPFLVAGQQ